MKGWKNTLILVGVCLGLGVYVKYFERGKVPEEGKISVRFEPKDVASIEVRSEKLTQPLTFHKEEKTWKITSPIETRGDKFSMDSIVDSLKELVSLQSIGKQSNLETFGLKEPLGTATVALKNGKRIRLLFGKKTIDSSNVYVMKEGDPRIMIVSSSTYDNFNKSLDDLRSKEVLSLKKDEIAKLTIATKSGSLALEKLGADWSVTAPLKTPAESTEMDTLLGKVAELKADKFVDDKPSDLHKYSLDKAWIQVELWKTTGKPPISLFIGKRSSTDTGKVFAMTSTDKPVFLLPDTMLTDLKKSAKDLRRKNVVDVKKDDVKTFTLTNQFGSFGVEKVGNDWKLFKPNTAKADGSTVDSLLYAVQDLKADEFIDSPKPLSAYGLDKPQMEFAVTAKSGSAKLLIGQATSDKKAVFAKADPGTTVCKVPASILDSLKKNLNDLRDKTVVKFDRKDLDQLSILREGKTLTVAHTGKDKWAITQPEKAEADSSKLSSTLYTLETLSADNVVAELPSDQQQAAAKLAYYGLDKPRVQVDLTIKKQKPVTLLVGKRTQSGDKVFFMRKGENTVYTKSDYLLTDLEKEVKDLKK